MNKKTQDGDRNGSGNGCGNGNRSEAGNERSARDDNGGVGVNGDEHWDGNWEGGGEVKKRKKSHKCRGHGVGNGT